jgi:hypothetical protein
LDEDKAAFIDGNHFAFALPAIGDQMDGGRRNSSMKRWARVEKRITYQNSLSKRGRWPVVDAAGRQRVFVGSAEFQ